MNEKRTYNRIANEAYSVVGSIEDQMEALHDQEWGGSKKAAKIDKLLEAQGLIQEAAKLLDEMAGRTAEETEIDKSHLYHVETDNGISYVMPLNQAKEEALALAGDDPYRLVKCTGLNCFCAKWDVE
jgi:hypothetical protein